MDAEATVIQFSPHVFLLYSTFVQSKRGLIVDDSGSVLIDTSVRRDETQSLLNKANELGNPVRRIVLTDGHFDHSAWCELAPSAERIAQKGAKTWMLSQHALDYLGTDPPEHPDLRKFTITPPTLELEGSAQLHLESGNLILFPTPGHSPSQMSALWEKEGVLFAGDAFITCFPPVIQDGRSDLAIESMRRIMQMEFEWLVPGHGPVVNRDVAQAHGQRSIDYLERMRTAIFEFNDLKTPLHKIENAVENLSSVFPPEIEMVAMWHQTTLEKIWKERREDIAQGRSSP